MNDDTSTSLSSSDSSPQRSTSENNLSTPDSSENVETLEEGQNVPYASDVPAPKVSFEANAKLRFGHLCQGIYLAEQQDLSPTAPVPYDISIIGFLPLAQMPLVTSDCVYIVVPAIPSTSEREDSDLCYLLYKTITQEHLCAVTLISDRIAFITAPIRPLSDQNSSLSGSPLSWIPGLIAGASVLSLAVLSPGQLSLDDFGIIPHPKLPECASFSSDRNKPPSASSAAPIKH